MFEASLLSSAERFLFEATADERQEIARIIDRVLCYDPWIDNKTKLAFSVPPAVLALYADAKYWILYRVVGNTKLSIWNIGYAHERVLARRPEDAE